MSVRKMLRNLHSAAVVPETVPWHRRDHSRVFYRGIVTFLFFELIYHELKDTMDKR